MRTTANLVFSGDVFGFIRDFKTRIKFVGRYKQPRALIKSLNLHLLPPKERNEKKVLHAFPFNRTSSQIYSSDYFGRFLET